MDFSIEAYVDKLIQEKGIVGVTDDVLQQLKNDLQDRAEDMINAEILANMPPQFLEPFEALLDSGSEEEIQQFCKEKILNLDELVAEALTSLRAAYLGIGV